MSRTKKVLELMSSLTTNIQYVEDVDHATKRYNMHTVYGFSHTVQSGLPMCRVHPARSNPHI